MTVIRSLRFELKAIIAEHQLLLTAVLLSAKVLFLVLCFGAAIWVAEFPCALVLDGSDACNDQFYHLSNCFYFCIITMSTVGSATKNRARS